MASGTKGYSSYRGRGRKGKLFLAILLILIIFASVGFIVAREHMTYDAEGNLHFPLPWTKETEIPPAADEIQESDVVIRDPEPAEKHEARLMPVQAVQLGEDPSGWETALTGDYNAFAVTMKAGGGTLCYPFETSVSGRKLSQHAETVQAALPELLDGELYSIARLSCLRDGGAARENLEAMGLENTGGYIFYDGSNENWLDPGKEETQAYLTALAKECAALGFDEILLTDLTYPTVGKLDKIAYTVPDGAAETDRAEALNTLLRVLREALPAEVKLSVEIPETVLEKDGIDEDAGIDLWNGWMSCLDRIYVSAAPERLDALVSDTLENGVLIPEVTALAEGTSYPCFLQLS